MLKEEMREMSECDMKEFVTLDSSEKTFVILGDRWWSQAGKQEGDKTSKQLLPGMHYMETTQ